VKVCRSRALFLRPDYWRLPVGDYSSTSLSSIGIGHGAVTSKDIGCDSGSGYRQVNGTVDGLC